jgi:hypothetical protein
LTWILWIVSLQASIEKEYVPGGRPAARIGPGKLSKRPAVARPVNRDSNRVFLFRGTVFFISYLLIIKSIKKIGYGSTTTKNGSIITTTKHKNKKVRSTTVN